MTDHPGAIRLENGDVLTEESAEVARIWVTNNAGSSVWIDASILGDPVVFGYLMADTIRHAARAYSALTGDPEDVQAERIFAGLREELSNQYNSIETIQSGRTVN
jgi:hypothetical protein